MIGDGTINEEAFKNLDGENIFIFLTEPDTEKWPQKMEPLKNYASEEKYTINDVLAYVQSLEERLNERESESTGVVDQLVRELNTADLSADKVDELKKNLIDTLDAHLKGE